MGRKERTQNELMKERKDAERWDETGLQTAQE